MKQAHEPPRATTDVQHQEAVKQQKNSHVHGGTDIYIHLFDTVRKSIPYARHLLLVSSD